MRKKIYAIDFDGTLSLDKFPYCGEPNILLIKLLKKLMEPPVENRDIWFVLHTCREGEYLERAIEWLKNQGLVFDSVNSVPLEISKIDTGGKRKLGADLYVDDKAITPENFLKLFGILSNAPEQKF